MPRGAAALLVLPLILIAARRGDGLRRDYARSQLRNRALLLSEELSSRLHDLDDELREQVVGASSISLDIAHQKALEKAINDRHEREEGNRCLVSVVRRVVQAQRETDGVARLGGDEFVRNWAPTPASLGSALL